MADRVGFIWDIDGVVLDSPHEELWRVTLMREPWKTEGLTSDLYVTHVASRPRLEGAHNILELLGVYERLGATSHEAKRELMERYASEKDSLTKELIGRGEFKLFADAVTLLLKAKHAGILQAAASASKNAGPLLRLVDRPRVLREVGHDFGAMSEGDTLYSVFDFDACGVERGGKVGILRYAARGLRNLVEGRIDKLFVFEDAASGMEAAKSLGYHPVGVLRIGDKQALEEAGAELVTEDLTTLEIDHLLRLG
jgi:beta-phosphoglucomutase-like phosphatase (HAD superfamily)